MSNILNSTFSSIYRKVFMKYISILFLLTNISFANICDEHFSNQKSPAQIEKDHLNSISRFQLATDGLRKFSKQILTASQISARQKARLLNSYLEMSTDYGLFYTQFKRLFLEAELSYYTMINIEKRMIKIKEIQSGLLDPHFNWGNFDQFISEHGLTFSLAKTSENAKIFLEKTVLKYKKDLEKAQKVFVNNYDDYVVVKYSLEETVNSSTAKAEIKEMAKNVSKNLGITDDELKLYPYLLSEQRTEGFTKLTPTEVKNFMESNIDLKNQLWKHRFKDQLGATLQYMIVHGKYHQKLIHSLNGYVPTSNVAFRTLKKLLGKITKDLVNYETHVHYAGFVGMQVHPGTIGKSLDDQMKVLLNANAHSPDADGYLIALARNVDAKETFNRLKKHAESKEEYKEIFKSMEEAEVKANLIGDLPLDQDRSFLARLPLYAAEMAFVWTLYEYFLVSEEEEKPIIDVTTEEGKKLLESLSKKSLEELESDPTIKLIIDKLEKDTLHK